MAPTNAPGQIPPPNNSTFPNQSNDRRNYVKYFNNWNVCFSCGFDVPNWHTSKTCQWRKEGHCEEVDRSNAKAYKAAGHNVTMKGSHKTQLPVNPGPHQA